MKLSIVLLVFAAVEVTLPSMSNQQGTSLSPLDYCEPGTPPPPPTGCPSCQSQCGHTSGYNDTMCSCDTSCVVYGDCCEDFKDVCPSEALKASQTDPRMLNMATKCVDLADTSASAVIESCLDGSLCASRNKGQLNRYLPVIDVTTELQYSHAECALCNKVQKASPWNASVDCKRKHYDITSVDILNQLLGSGACTLLLFGPPMGFDQRSCIEPRFTKCQGCANQALVKKCQGGTQSFTSGSMYTYKNYYCALCSGGSFHGPPVQCGVVGNTLGGSTKIESGPTTFGGSLSIIFDFNPKKGLQVGGSQGLSCPPGEVPIPGGGCRERTCPKGQRLEGSTCIPLVFKETITATVLFNKTQDASYILQYIEDPKNNWEKDMEQNIQSVDDPNYSISSAEVDVNENDPSSFNVTALVTVSLMKNGTFNDTSRHNMVMGIRGKIIVNINELLGQFNIENDNVRMVFDNQSLILPKWKTECNWVFYQQHEYELDGTDLTLIKSKTTYSEANYKIYGDQALVCVSLGTRIAYPEYSKPLEIVAMICTILSILCLLTRIGLQFIFPYFSSFAGRLQFHLCLALCLAYIFMLIGGALKDTSPRAPCYVVGVLTYAAFLAAFGWMTAAAINTWIVFRPSSSFIKADDKSQSLVSYAILGWVFPIVLSVMVIGIDFTTIDPRYKPSFADPLCWISQKYALIVFFMVPILCSVVINFIMFVLIACVLRKTFKEAVTTTGNSPNQRQHLAVYVRLFILMGVSWSLGFIAAFSGLLPIWIIFVILNASQGVFIFISFVCRRPILKMIFKRWAKPDESRSLSGSHTKSTRASEGDNYHVPLSAKRTMSC